jgi:hypothetical protein
MHALQRAKCNTRDKLQKMRIQEPPPQEQREKGLILQAL